MGICLRDISQRSYDAFGFLKSAVVVRDDENKMPSKAFFTQAIALKLLSSRANEDQQFEFWAKQVQEVRGHYRVP